MPEVSFHTRITFELIRFRRVIPDVFEDVRVGERNHFPTVMHRRTIPRVPASSRESSDSRHGVASLPRFGLRSSNWTAS
jgi:hypothetical protein